MEASAKGGFPLGIFELTCLVRDLLNKKGESLQDLQTILQDMIG